MQTAVGRVDRAGQSRPRSAAWRAGPRERRRWRCTACSSSSSSPATRRAPEELVLDIDASDVPLHGGQETQRVPRLLRPPLLLAAVRVLRPGDAGVRTCGAAASTGPRTPRRSSSCWCTRLRQAWPDVRIIVRADSGFCRQRLLRWCERSGVSYVVGLARNARLQASVQYAEAMLADEYARTGSQAAADRRVRLRGRELGHRAARDHAAGVRQPGQQPALRGHQPRRATPSSCTSGCTAQRGEAENRIKEAQLDLFGTRASCHRFAANQLRLLLAALAYTLMQRLRSTCAARAASWSAPPRPRSACGCSRSARPSCATRAACACCWPRITRCASCSLSAAPWPLAPLNPIQCCPRHADKQRG